MTTKPRPVFPQFILILTYMRSGSSLTGDVMQQHNDTFYSFEPLYNVWENNVSTFLNGKTKVYNGSAGRMEESLKQLNAWYKCEPLELDMQTMKHIFMTYSRKLRSVQDCMKTFAATAFSRVAKEKCILPFIRRCKRSKVRIVKTIRLQIRDVKPLLQRMPNLKIVHLFRDPRGILLSRKRVEIKSLNQLSMEQAARELCDRIMDNEQTIVSYSKRYPGRIKSLQYEQLATFPLRTVRELYKFANLETTSTIMEKIQNMTRSKDNIEEDYNTRRKNSVFTANAWRLKLSLNTSHAIDNACKVMYSTFGYIPAISSKQLQSLGTFRTWANIHT